MSDPQANLDPSTPDPEAALKAYNATLPCLETLSKDSYVTLSVDPRDASVIALSVGRFIAEPAVRARFDLLHEATEVKARMLDLCDYNFRRDTRVSA